MTDRIKPHGACHWLLERLTSLALIPLCLWFVWSLIGLRDASYAGFTAWLALPANTALMCAVIVIGLLHGAMGSQVIAEDYLTGWLRKVKIIGIWIFSIALAAIALLAIHHIVF